MKFIDLNSLKSCRLLSAYERYRPVLNKSLLSRSIFQDHLFNTRFIVIFEIELKLIPLIQSSRQVIYIQYIYKSSIVKCEKLEIYSLSQSIFSKDRILNLNPLAKLEFAHNIRQSWNSKRCFFSSLRSHYFVQFTVKPGQAFPSLAN